MHIAILMANTDESAFSAQHPKDGEKFRALLQPLRPDWQFSTFAVKDSVFPDDLDGFDGFIITGSPASVHDDVPWIGQLLALIRRIVAKNKPIYGACFGHQAIALALGGQVGQNPGGWVFGLTETNEDDAGPIRLYAAHREQVTKLPAGAKIRSQSAECAVGSFAIGDHVLTTQYHPEMTPEFIAALTDALEDKLPSDTVANAKASLASTAETNRIAQRIVRFFEGKV